MKTLYDGKTKTVKLNEETGVVYLFFKDSATGENGVFDPGSNSVGGSVEGKGNIGLQVSKYFDIVENTLTGVNNGDAAAAGAEIGKVCILRQASDGFLHQNFGIRARDQTIGRHLVGLSIELPLSHQILQRVALSAAIDCLCERGAGKVFVLGEGNAIGRDMAEMLDEQRGIPFRGFDARVLQTLADLSVCHLAPPDRFLRNTLYQ